VRSRPTRCFLRRDFVVVSVAMVESALVVVLARQTVAARAHTMKGVESFILVYIDLFCLRNPMRLCISSVLDIVQTCSCK
jgi:membrane protein CcdC involved in cytochrome C biogenesis